MEVLLYFSIFALLFFIAGVCLLITMGGLLLCDLVFKTHIGRKTCKWFRED